MQIKRNRHKNFEIPFYTVRPYAISVWGLPLALRGLVGGTSWRATRAILVHEALHVCEALSY
jgi:hypothetical protein